MSNSDCYIRAHTGILPGIYATNASVKKKVEMFFFSELLMRKHSFSHVASVYCFALLSLFSEKIVM
jgi:hypothetical protein